MIISFAQVLLLVIVIFGVAGVFRGVRSVALTTAAIFFAIVVVIFSGDLVIQGLRRLGVPLDSPDTQDIFVAVLFVFTLSMGALVLGRIVPVSRKGLKRSEKLWGFALGLLNGFLIMAVIEHYVANAIQATQGPGSAVSVGVPSLLFSHPTPDTWSVRLVSSALTLLPPGPNADLWAKLPTALILLLLFLGFVFVGTVYGRVSRSRG